MSLKGKVAVVTGAGSGIGRAIALALAREGAAVCIADMDEAAGRRVVGEVGAAGVRGHFVRTDVSQSGPVRAMVEETVKTLGRLDILVNNAGVQYVAPIVDYPEDRWNLLIGVMLTGTVGPGCEHRLRTRTRRLPVQVRLCRCQARDRGIYQGGSVGGGGCRDYSERHLPGVCAHPACRKADCRSGSGAQHSRVRGGGAHYARAPRD